MRRDNLKSEVGTSFCKLHAVMVPFPAQGHINAHLLLAKQLIGLYGFAVTFVNTTHNHERILKAHTGSATSEWGSNLKFVAVSDGLPPDDPRADLEIVFETILKMEATFEELFQEILNASSINCVIRDVNMPSVHNAARKYGIPVSAFVTMSAVGHHCYSNMKSFVDAGLVPLPAPLDPTLPAYDRIRKCLRAPQTEEEAAARKQTVGHCLPGLAPELKVEDLPSMFITHDLDTFFCRVFLYQQNKTALDCDSLLANTFFELEFPAIENMNQNSKVLPVGPLSMPASDFESSDAVFSSSCSLWTEDPAPLQWLDAQRPASVLYISFGSLATQSVEQMQEIAHGLEASNHPFLWVIRENLVQEDADSTSDFRNALTDIRNRTKQRAFITPWVSQLAVLSHPSVGAFLTHCGWNSTIESISCGLPMLTWPRFAEQRTNAFYITHVWKVGLGFESDDSVGLVRSKEVARKVRSILVKPGKIHDTDKMRQRARDLQNAAKRAVNKGGTSARALAAFVNLIRSKLTIDTTESRAMSFGSSDVVGV